MGEQISVIKFLLFLISYIYMLDVKNTEAYRKFVYFTLHRADIISLQEVETDQFYNFFVPELRKDGYEGVFSPKSR